MFRYVILICSLCWGGTTTAQANWDSLLKVTTQMMLADQHSEMLRVSQYGDSLLQQTAHIDSYYLAAFRHQMGTAWHVMGDYRAAIQGYDSAITACAANPEGLNEKGKALFDRAFAEYSLEDYYQSYRSVEAAEAILSQLEAPDYDYLFSIYADLAYQTVEFGYYDKAEMYLKKAEKLFKVHHDKVEYLSDNQASKEVMFQYNYVLLYSETGDKTRMYHHLKLMQAMHQQGDFNEEEQLVYAVTLNHAADFYLNHDQLSFDTDRFEAAHDLLKQAFAALDKETYPDHYQQFLYNQNKAYRKSGHYEKARAGNRTLQATISPSDSRMPFFIAQECLISMSSGDKEAALEAFDRMVQFIHSGKNPLLADHSNFQPSAELNHTDLMAGISDELLAAFPGDSLVRKHCASYYQLALKQFIHSYQTNTFNQKLRDFYEKAVNGILGMRALGYGTHSLSLSEVLNAIENIENRLAWKEHLQHRHVNVQYIPDSLLSKEMSLRKEIALAKEKQSPELVIFELEDALRKHLQAIRTQYPAHAQLVNDTFDIVQFQQSLPPKTLVIRYKRLQSTNFLFGISPEEVRLWDLGEDDTLTSQIQQYIQALQARQPCDKLGNSLCEVLLPLDISAYDQLIILPDGPVNDVPFEALIYQDQYLMRSHVVSYASHLVFVNGAKSALAPQNRPDHTPFLAFSPTYAEKPIPPGLVLRSLDVPLVGARAEAKTLAEMLGGRMFQGADATKATFIREAPKAQVLHLAMHAAIDNQQPELSYLLFSATPPTEKMYIEELYGVNLQADLAVLSACNTGKGLQDEGRGMVSLNRAFCYAGVPATVASLWAVPDRATQQVMVTFYQNLLSGLSKAEALQQAKLTYLEGQDPNFSHPFFWAGFTLYGDRGPIFLPQKTSEFPGSYWKWSLCLLAVLLIGGMAKIWRKFDNLR